MIYHTKKLVRPVVPVDYLADFFTNVGTETLSRQLANGGPSTAVDELYQAICWFKELKIESDDFEGRISAANDDQAVEQLLAGWNALRELGDLD